MKKNNQEILRIGTAGWIIPQALREYFPNGESLLERYSQVFNIVEINSTFHRSHQKKTYAKWASCTPPNFQFSVKMPKEITHTHRLEDVEDILNQFVDEVSELQDKLGPILVQLPKSLDFNPQVADLFIKLLRAKFVGKVALEARHNSWASSEAVVMLSENNITQVIADPAVIEVNRCLAQSFKYFRLHGSPHVYSSSYPASFLEDLMTQLDQSSYVIFDNTRLGAATQNAIDLKKNFNMD